MSAPRKKKPKFHRLSDGVEIMARRRDLLVHAQTPGESPIFCQKTTWVPWGKIALALRQSDVPWKLVRR